MSFSVAADKTIGDINLFHYFDRRIQRSCCYQTIAWLIFIGSAPPSSDQFILTLLSLSSGLYISIIDKLCSYITWWCVHRRSHRFVFTSNVFNEHFEKMLLSQEVGVVTEIKGLFLQIYSCSLCMFLYWLWFVSRLYGS